MRINLVPIIVRKLLSVFLSSLFLVSSSLAEEGQIRLIGHYSDIETYNISDPHQLGYAVDLYERSDGMIFGDFTYAPGTTEGFGATLYDIQLNKKTKVLTFKAKLSAGREMSKDYDRDAQNIFTFSGSLGNKFIIGNLVITSGYAPAVVQKKINVKLRRDRSKREGSYKPKSYNEWLESALPIPNW